MGLEELLAEQEQLLAAPSVAPSIMPSMPTVTAPTSGSEYERRLNDILGRRQALQQQIAGSEQAISAMDILGGLATGVGQGTTLGWGDELVARVRSLLPDVTYEQALAEQQAQLAQARDVAPIATGIGEIGTASLTPLGMAKSVRALGGLKGVAGEVLTGAPRLAGQTLKQTFIPSAISGTVYGAGAAEPGDRLSGALVGGGIGGAVPLALSGVASAIGKAATTGARMGLTPQAEVGAALLNAGVTQKEANKAAKLVNAYNVKGSAVGSAYTSAEATQNPLLAALERNLPTNIKAQEPALAKQKQGVPVIRETALSSLSDLRNVNPADTGDAIKTALLEEDERIKKGVSALYDNLTHTAVDKKVATSLNHQIERQRNKYFDVPKFENGKKLGRPTEPDDVDRLLTSLQKEPSVTTKQLLIYRRNIDDLIAKYDAGKQREPVALLSSVRDDITNILKKQPGKEWETANDAYRKYAQTFVNGSLPNVGKNEKLNAENVVDRITRSQANAKQFIDQTKNVLDVRKQAQAQVISDISAAFESGETKTINQIVNNLDVYKQLFEDQPNVVKTFTDIINQYRASTKATKLANPVLNSTTANKMLPLMQDLLGGARTETEKAQQLAQRVGTSLAAGLAGSVVAGPLGMIPSALLGLTSGGGTYGFQKFRQAKRLDALGAQLADMLINPISLQKGLKAGASALQKLKTAGALGQTAQEIAGGISGGTSRTGIAATNQLGGEPSGSITPMSTPDLNELSKRVQELLGPTEAQAAVRPIEAETPKGLKWAKVPGSVSAEISRQEPLIQAMIYQESRGNPKAKSKAGAAGLMQLMPGTAKELGVKDVLDAKQNIAAGTKYIEKMRSKFGDDSLALAAYNWGPGNVSKAVRQAAKALKKDASEVTWDDILSEVTVPTETKKYVERVFRLREQFSGQV